MRAEWHQMRLERWAEVSGNFAFIGITVGINRRAFIRGLTRSGSGFSKIPLTGGCIGYFCWLNVHRLSCSSQKCQEEDLHWSKVLSGNSHPVDFPVVPLQLHELAWAGGLPKGGMTPREPQCPSRTGIDRDDNLNSWDVHNAPRQGLP